jgi:hypothetical protein
MASWLNVETCCGLMFSTLRSPVQEPRPKAAIVITATGIIDFIFFNFIVVFLSIG